MRKIVLFVFMISVFIASCIKERLKDSDESGSIDVNIYGKWEVITGIDDIKYLTINNDNSCYVLTEDSMGFKKEYSDFALLTGSQILIDQGIFNYCVSSNSLIMTNIEDTISLSRNNNAPDQDDWIKEITLISSFKAPIATSIDLTWDGQYLWYGNAYSSKNLYKINPETNTVDTVSITNYAFSIEFDGQYLWISHNGSDKIYKVDTVSGSILSESVSMGAWIRGIAWDGQYLWSWSNNEHTMYQYDPQNNIIVSQHTFGWGASGIAYVNGYFYLCMFGDLHKCTNTFHAVESYTLDNHYIEGIAYDGNNFWISADGAIHKVSLN